MKRDELVMKLDSIVDKIRGGSSLLDYGAKVIISKTDKDGEREIDSTNLNMDIDVEASCLAELDEITFTYLMGAVYSMKTNKIVEEMEDEED